MKINATQPHSWHGDGTGTYCRLAKGKKVRCDVLDPIIIRKVSKDLSSPEFIKRVMEAITDSLKPPPTAENEKTIRAEFKLINNKIVSLAAILSETAAPAAALRQIERYEFDRSAIPIKQEAVEKHAGTIKDIQMLTEKDSRKAVEHNIEELEN